MKLIGRVFVVIVALLSCMEAFASDLTLRDLEGFKRPQTILKYKDLKLPNPEPPSENGINSGGVIILGRYMPPPYEVMVSSDGKHVLINSVPCTNLRELVNPGLNEKQLRAAMIKSDIEVELRNLYQRTKHFKDEKEAERLLLDKIENLEKEGFENLGITKGENEIFEVVAKVSGPWTDEPMEARVIIKKGDDPVAAIKRRVAMFKPEIVQVHEYKVISKILKKIVVHLNHAETEKFDVEVESKQAEKTWICNEGTKSIQDKKMELQGKFGHFSIDKIEKELTEFALSIPWIKSFKCKRDSRSDSLAGFEVNGVNCGFLLDYVPEDNQLEKKSLDERIEEYRQRQEIMRQETVEIAERIKNMLERNQMIVFDHGFESLENYPDLLPSIRKIMKSPSTLKEKRDGVLTLLRNGNKSIYSLHAEFIAFFWDKPWGQEI